MMTELERAIALANRVLDRPSGDPDDDLAILARQFLRSQERCDQLAQENKALSYQDWDALQAVYQKFKTS